MPDQQGEPGVEVRVRAARQAVGDDASIRVDGNAAYSFADARVVLHELSRFHITDAEQPLTRSDLRSLAELRRAVGIPIAVQESVSSPEDALAVLEEQAADLLKIKLTHIGGFESAREVAHRGEDRPILQLAFGLAKARQIDDDDPAAGSQWLDILSIVAEAGRPGPAAVDQDRRLALPDIMVAGTGSGDVDKLVG